MVDYRLYPATLRTIFILCFVLLVISCLPSALWMLLSIMSWGWPLPLPTILIIGIFLVQIISLVVYFRWPWIAVAVSWVDMLMILSGAIPWRGHSAHSFVHQFGFDLMFFGVAHVGFIASRLQRSTQAGHV